MTDKEAMKLALDALETLMIERESIYEKAIAALKERLADPMREVQRLGQEIEQCNYPDCKCPTEDPCLKGLAQPEQEPVAHCKVRPLRGDESFPKVEIDWVNQPVPGPLYTHPPQRKPLTDEEMKKIWYAMQNIMGWYSFQEIARAIEAAHGIKENQ